MEPYASSTLPNGLKVFSYFDENLPAVYMALVVRAGYRYESDEQIGYAHFLEHMLLKGTKKFPSPVEFARQIDSVGAYKNGFTSHERAWYTIHAAKEFAEPMTDLLSQIILEPNMDPQVAENEKKPILEEIEKAEFVDHERALNMLAAREFFRGHPLARSILDSQETTSKATVPALLAYRDDFYSAARSALVFVGGVPHADVRKLAESHFGSWERGRGADDPVPFMPKYARHLHINRDLPQTYIRLSFNTVPAGDVKTQAALRLLRAMLSLGGSALLKEELRHKRGLVYAVTAGVNMYLDAGTFFISTFSKDPAETIRVIREVLAKVPELVTDESVETLKQQVTGAQALYLADPVSRLDDLLPRFIWFDRLVTPEEKIQELSAVTADDVRAVAMKYFSRDNSMLATLGRTDPGDL